MEFTDSNSISDSILIQRAQNSDADAFGEIFERYAQRVFHFIFARLDNRLEAEDLTEEVFLRALRSLPNYEERGLSFAPFLFQIARNTLADYYHKNSQSPKNLPIYEIPLEADPNDADPVRIESNNRKHQELISAISKLKKEYREVLVLRFLHDLPPTEVAEIMGRSQGSVRVLQHRALNALRKVIIVLVMVTLSLGTTGVTYAANGSLPGDNLYGIKRTVEDIRLGVSLTGLGDAQLQVQFAEVRFTEIHDLIVQGRYADIAVALEILETDLDVAIRSVAEELEESEERDQLVGELDNILIEHVDILNGLLVTAPEAASEAIEKTLDVSMQGQDAIQAIQNEKDDSAVPLLEPSSEIPEQETSLNPSEEQSNSGNPPPPANLWKYPEEPPQNNHGQENSVGGNSGENHGAENGGGYSNNNGNSGNNGNSNGNGNEHSNGNGNGNGNNNGNNNNGGNQNSNGNGEKNGRGNGKDR